MTVQRSDYKLRSLLGEVTLGRRLICWTYVFPWKDSMNETNAWSDHRTIWALISWMQTWLQRDSNPWVFGQSHLSQFGPVTTNILNTRDRRVGEININICTIFSISWTLEVMTIAVKCATRVSAKWIMKKSLWTWVHTMTSELPVQCSTKSGELTGKLEASCMVT